jgi:hypothetical protein
MAKPELLEKELVVMARVIQILDGVVVVAEVHQQQAHHLHNQVR